MEKYRNAIDVVTTLAVFLRERTDYRIFPYNKDDDYSGDYIVINNLPFTYGKLVNDNAINVNVHALNNPSGSLNKQNLSRMYQDVVSLIPYTNDSIESDNALILDNISYEIQSDSNVMDDKDNTHFINLRIKVKF